MRKRLRLLEILFNMIYHFELEFFSKRFPNRSSTSISFLLLSSFLSLFIRKIVHVFYLRQSLVFARKVWFHAAQDDEKMMISGMRGMKQEKNEMNDPKKSVSENI